MIPTIHRTRWREVEGEVLDERELERASRFASEVDRARFVAARTFLRRTLGALLDRDPAGISFVFGEHGKPTLADGSIHFSLTHAGDWIAVATSEHAPVGVDVEEINPATELELTANAVLTENELRLLDARGCEAQRAFFQIWTCKEASLKAWGVGLSVDPRELDVSRVLDAVDAVAIGHETLGLVTVHQFWCDDTHAGAVAWLTEPTPGPLGRETRASSVSRRC